MAGGRSGRVRRWVIWIVLGLLVLVLAALAGGYWYARPLLLTGTGYAAHNACALQHIADREPLDSDLPPNPLVPYLRTSGSDLGAQSGIWGVLAQQQAWFNPDYGCTVADQAPDTATWSTASRITTDGNPYATVTPGPAPAAVTDAINRAFGDDLDQPGRTNLGTRAVVVLHRGQLVAERYANGFTPATPQLGWSMAKSVTNLLTGVLVAEGRVTVDDPQLRPEWTDDRSRITVDQLMRMTSGLQWDETYDLGTPITRMLYLEPDMAGYVASLPLAHPPGTHQQYSSGSTNLLCSVLVEAAEGGPNLPRAELFGPLGLSSAIWEPDATGNPVCSSYLWATPRDWATLGQFALQDGVWRGERLLPEGWLAQSTTVKPVATAEEVGYAAGWWVNRLPDGTLADPTLPADAYWASGHDGQRLYVVPSEQLVVVRLGFSPGVFGPDLRTAALVHDLGDALP